MALTKVKVREILSTAGVDADHMSEAVNAIIDGHVASIDALREENGNLKAELKTAKKKTDDAQAAAQALAALTPDEREIVTLHAVAGLSLREIAEMTGRPLGTIKWKHAEAIKKLRSLLGEGFGREGTE